MVAEDPFLTVSIDVESGQAIMMGVSESLLDMHVDTLRRTYQIEVAVGAPQVAYREGLGRAADIDYIHDSHTGGGRQFARVKILFEPGEPGSGFVFESRISDGAVADEYIPGVLKGIELAKDNGLLAGFPVIDFRATLHGGASDARDSSILAFEIASRAAFRQLRDRGSPKLMEPIMKVEVVTPGEYMGEVMADLNSRRGHFQSSETRGKAEVVSALVPLANMFGYAPRLRGLSRGRAQFSMLFDHYAPTPLPDGEGPTFSPAIGMRA